MNCCTPKMEEIAVRGDGWKKEQFTQFVSEIWTDIVNDSEFSGFVEKATEKGWKKMP